MKTTMSDYYKLVLIKVSFDERLFSKEFSNAVKWIPSEEVPAFREWISTAYGSLFSAVLQNEFIVQNFQTA